MWVSSLVLFPAPRPCQPRLFLQIVTFQFSSPCCTVRVVLSAVEMRLFNQRCFTALAALALHACAALAALSSYTAYTNTDITPCLLVCTRVGNCGYGYGVTCDPKVIAAACDATGGCVAFNSNGWLKGCGNSSCGATFEGSQGTTSYVKNGGVPVPVPLPPVAPVEDVHYPAEEVKEAMGAAAPAVLVASAGGRWAVVRLGGTAPVNVSVGAGAASLAFGFELVAVLSSVPGVGGPVALLERTFQRWGFLSYVLAATAGGGEVARLRKGVGAALGLTMPNYAYLANGTSDFYGQVSGNLQDILGTQILNETAGEPTFVDVAKYLPPQRDYAHIGAVKPYQKYSVSPDGRVKTADGAIYTPTLEASDPGPGLMVFDPATILPWPQTNFSVSKSALVGGHLRVVAVTSFDPATGQGFEQVAFGPASFSPSSTFVRLRSVSAASPNPPFLYYTAANNTKPTTLDETAFYESLYEEQALWNGTFSVAAGFNVPGQEGARYIDTIFGPLVSGLSLFIGLTPNYGDGYYYWSPTINDGGQLPFNIVPIAEALMALNLTDAAAQRVGYWFNAFVTPSGAISWGTWETSCPFQFADSYSDYGIVQALFARTARAVLSNNAQTNASAWLESFLPPAIALTNYSYNLRLNATAKTVPGSVSHGLIWGPPEHDTCHEPDYYFHVNVWFIRGMIEMGRLLVDICPKACPQYTAFGSVLLAEASRFQADLNASLALSVVKNASGAPYFIPPYAGENWTPFTSMIESVVSEYSNFRYYSELLGADILPADMAVALIEFRETHQGTVGGITRWSDHLDNMPSSHYLSSALWYDRVDRFLLMQYGHMANYAGRGTFTATEQLPIFADANGYYRDYLWGYLEGGIDECVSSIMLPSVGAIEALVLERFDEDKVYLGRGVPHRWADSARGNGFGVSSVGTRFGLVSFQHSAGVAIDSGHAVSVSVSFTPTLSPGVTPTPVLVLRLRSPDAGEVLDAGSVTIEGGGVVSALDATVGDVVVALTGPAPYAFVVKAVFKTVPAM